MVPKVQRKKAAVWIIFLLSISVGLFIKLGTTDNSSLNIMMISPKENTTDFSLTKIIWNDLETLQNDLDLEKNYSTIDIKYAQAKDAKTLNNLSKDVLTNKDIIVLVGDSYNSSLDKIISEYPNEKFILLESSYKGNYKNLYKINIDWKEIFSKIVQEIEANIKLEKKEAPVKVAYITNSTEEEQEKYNDFMTYANKNSKITVFPIIFDNASYQSVNTKLTELYEEEEITYFVSPDYDLQFYIVEVLTKLQKKNVYQLNQQEKALLNKKNNTDTTDTKTSNTTDTTVKYKKIFYYGVFGSDLTQGAYSDLNFTESNIFAKSININFTSNLKKIILTNDTKKTINLKFGQGDIQLLAPNEEKE